MSQHVSVGCLKGTSKQGQAALQRALRSDMRNSLALGRFLRQTQWGAWSLVVHRLQPPAYMFA